MNTASSRTRIALAGSLLFHGALATWAALSLNAAPVQVEISSIEVIADSSIGNAPVRAPHVTSAKAPGQIAAAPTKPSAGSPVHGAAIPSAASASSSSHVVNTAVNLYLSLVRDRIGASIRFPHGAVLAPIRVMLKLTLLPDGEVKTPSLTQSSGRAEFDRSILDAVGRAGPFPRFSPEMSSFHELSVSLPIEIRPRAD